MSKGIVTEEGGRLAEKIADEHKKSEAIGMQLVAGLRPAPKAMGVAASPQTTLFAGAQGRAAHVLLLRR
jgi:hypothetical protein